MTQKKKALLPFTSSPFFFFFIFFLLFGYKKKRLLAQGRTKLQLGLAIYARSAGTRSSPTLMDWILPNLINNRVSYGLKKNPATDPGQVRVLVIPSPNLTRIHI